MIKQKAKLIFTLIVFVVLMVVMTIFAYANTNENVEIVRTGTDYLIYIREHHNTDFTFTFSNDESDSTQMLNRAAGLDAQGNRVAYINDVVRVGAVDFNAPVFLFVNNVSQGEININTAIEGANLEIASNKTRNIPVTIGSLQRIEMIDGVEVRVTVGKLEIVDRIGNYEYQLIRVVDHANYARLTSLANHISRFDVESVNIFTRIQVYREFLELYNTIQAEIVGREWSEAAGNDILQPESSETGDRYIVWIRNRITGEIDVQFMTATREYNEETIIERITTQLPVTGENYTVFIILGTLIAAIIVVGVMYKKAKRKEQN